MTRLRNLVCLPLSAGMCERIPSRSEVGVRSTLRRLRTFIFSCSKITTIFGIRRSFSSHRTASFKGSIIADDIYLTVMSISFAYVILLGGCPRHPLSFSLWRSDFGFLVVLDVIETLNAAWSKKIIGPRYVSGHCPVTCSG